MDVTDMFDGYDPVSDIFHIAALSKIPEHAQSLTDCALCCCELLLAASSAEY